MFSKMSHFSISWICLYSIIYNCYSSLQRNLSIFLPNVYCTKKHSYFHWILQQLEDLVLMGPKHNTTAIIDITGRCVFKSMLLPSSQLAKHGTSPAKHLTRKCCVHEQKCIKMEFSLVENNRCVQPYIFVCIQQVQYLHDPSTWH